jgi:enoyl-CoA hydratase
VRRQPEVRHTSNTTYLFTALCGWKTANRYGLTGDHFDAAEAYRIGMVNEVVPPEELMPTARRLALRIAQVPEPSIRMNKAVSMVGLQVSGVFSAMALNGPLSALSHTSHGPQRERLLEAQRNGGMRAYLDERDGPFLPEPFGPKSHSSRTTPA